MNKQINISVIVLIHNRKDCLLEALESIRRQSFTDYEVNVVDDGEEKWKVKVGMRKWGKSYRRKLMKWKAEVGNGPKAYNR